MRLAQDQKTKTAPTGAIIQERIEIKRIEIKKIKILTKHEKASIKNIFQL